MARKQKKEAEPMKATAEPETDIEQLRAVRLDIPLSMHRELRMAAAKRDQSMAALVKGLVEDFLAEERGGK